MSDSTGYLFISENIEETTTVFYAKSVPSEIAAYIKRVNDNDENDTQIDTSHWKVTDWVYNNCNSDGMIKITGETGGILRGLTTNLRVFWLLSTD